jgi:cytochrome c5
MDMAFRKSNPTAPALTSAVRFGLAAVALAAPLVATAATPTGQVGSDVVKSHCGKCHEPGTANAPKIGDKAAWAPRLQRGIDALLLVAIRGHGGMPPRGGKADLTDAELRDAILYMFNPAGPPKDIPKGAMAPIPPGAGPNRATAGGMDIYLGRMSAEQLRKFPAGSPETKLHGGIPTGSGYYHVNISVFDTATQAPVTGATVELDIEQVGMGRQTAKIEPVTLAGGSGYGGYVRLAPKSSYVFTVRARKPGAGAPVEVTFRERVD